MSAYSTKILADSPLAYWRLDEASGNLTDLSGNSKTATAAGTAVTYGSASIVPNENDQCMTFADNDNSFEGTDDADFELQTFSCEAWILPTALAASNISSILAKSTGLGTNGFVFGVTTGPVVGIGPRGPASLSTYSSAISYNTAYHVVGVVTPTIVQLYVNGALVVDSTRSVATTHTTGTVRVGNITTTAGFVGRIDEVAFYTTALTAAQVKNHYDVQSTWSGQPKGLLLPRRDTILLQRRTTLLPRRRGL